jgi:hypothetical protein
MGRAPEIRWLHVAAWQARGLFVGRRSGKAGCVCALSQNASRFVRGLITDRDMVMSARL